MTYQVMSKEQPIGNKKTRRDGAVITSRGPTQRQDGPTISPLNSSITSGTLPFGTTKHTSLTQEHDLVEENLALGGTKLQIRNTQIIYQHQPQPSTLVTCLSIVTKSTSHCQEQEQYLHQLLLSLRALRSTGLTKIPSM
jgi:hypothetical protein